MIDTRVTVGSVEFHAPVMTASGTAGYGTELAGHLDLAALGAVVTKSLAAFEWPGNPAPRLHPTPQGMMNAVGLQGPGVQYWLDHVVGDLVASGATVVASIWGRSVDDYAQAAELLAVAPSNIVAVEVNLSCPNLEGRGSIFAHDARLSAEVMAATAACGRPRWAKLSANTDRIIDVADAVMAAGADAVTCINTLLGLAYDPRTLAPTLGAGGGGCPGAPSTRWPCEQSMTSIGRSPRCRSSVSAGLRRPGMRSSCCSPAHRRFRWARRRSPIPAPLPPSRTASSPGRPNAD